ncbi:MAG: homoserine kinase [Spirochaetia bacterium]|nr:homoserine kinase [Spirochaetia bacterium]
MKIKVSVPASSANIGPGYDIWGMALNIRNEFIVQPSAVDKSHRIEVRSGQALLKTSAYDPREHLENPSDNLFIKSYETLFERAGLNVIHIFAEISLEIPLSRGLGSSSSAIVAGLLSANEVIRKTHGKAFSIMEIYHLATELEGHPDNVGPALFGGWVLNIKDGKSGLYKAVKLNLNAPLRLAGVIPHITLSTKEARKVVPENNSLNVTTFQSTRTALMVHLLGKSSWDDEDRHLFSLAIEDRVHQQMRSSLIPGMIQTFSLWQNQGALGCYLSGSGTTLLSFWGKENTLKNIDFRSSLLNNGIESTIIYPEIDFIGATVEPC